MPALIPINGTTFKIVVGRDEIELGDIDASQCLAHIRHKRWSGLSDFVLSYPGTPSGLVMIDVPNGIVRIPYGSVDVEITAHDPDDNNPDGRSEFNVILKSKPTLDANGEYWQEVAFESTGMTFERVLGLDEEWSQQDCYDHWYDDLYDDHVGNDLYGHDNGTGTFVRTPTEIRTPDGVVVIKSRPEHLVHSLLGTAIQNQHYTSELGEIRIDTPNKGKQLKYTYVSRDHLGLPRRELIDDKGARARIEDIQIVGNKIRFKLPKAWLEHGSRKFPVKHTTGLDPAYTEDMDTFGPGLTEGSWTQYNIANLHSIPSGSVVEVIITNKDTGKEYWGGVRENGTILDRRVQLHEAEGGGVTTCRMFTKMLGNLIQYYTQENTDIVFTIVGYWENVDFTELFSKAPFSGVGSWASVQLSDPNAADRVCHFLLDIEDENSYTLGVRTVGSSLERKILAHEAEGGGSSTIDMIAKASATYHISQYTSGGAADYLIHTGYFGAELDFIEGYTEVDAVLSGGVWGQMDMSAYLDEDGRVCDFLLANDVYSSEYFIGVRDGDDTTTNRYIEEHEGEGDIAKDYPGFGMSAKSNSSGMVYGYKEGANCEIYFLGYFKPTAAPPVAVPRYPAVMFQTPAIV